MKAILFFGAGSSRPFGVPTMQELPGHLEQALDGEDAKLFSDVRRGLEEFGIRADLEAVFTVLNDYGTACKSDLLPPAIAYRFGNTLKDPLRSGQGIEREIAIENLRRRIQAMIVEKCEISGQGQKIFETFHDFLAALAQSFNKDVPNLLLNHDVNFYTTNYDGALATFVHKAHSLVPSLRDWKVENGTTMTDPIHWDTYNYTNQSTMLVPLHGSVELHTTDTGVVRYHGRPPELYGESLTGELLIFPVRGKYIIRDPFARMFKWLSTDLEVAEFAIFVGFSFSDEAIRDILRNAMERRVQLKQRGAGEVLRIVVIGPSASKIVDDKLADHRKFVRPIDASFEDIKAHTELTRLLKASWQ